MELKFFFPQNTSQCSVIRCHHCYSQNPYNHDRNEWCFVSTASESWIWGTLGFYVLCCRLSVEVVPSAIFCSLVPNVSSIDYLILSDLPWYSIFGVSTDCVLSPPLALSFKILLGGILEDYRNKTHKAFGQDKLVGIWYLWANIELNVILEWVFSTVLVSSIFGTLLVASFLTLYFSFIYVALIKHPDQK